MENESSRIIKAFFLYMGVGFVILCIKVNLIKDLSYTTVRALFLTFIYCYTIAIWIGLAGMLTTLMYHYIKKNSINLRPCLTFSTTYMKNSWMKKTYLKQVLV